MSLPVGLVGVSIPGINPRKGRPYSVKGNPFAGRSGARKEIWAYGLRNPWRFTFDRNTGDLWIADVGQNIYEEVNFQPASSAGGENYGWNQMEGMHCYLSGCSQSRLVLPVAEYNHAEGCSGVVGRSICPHCKHAPILGRWRADQQHIV